MEFKPLIDIEVFQTEIKSDMGYVKIFPVILMIDVSKSIHVDRKREKIQELFANIISTLKEMEQVTDADEMYSTRVSVMIISDEPRWVKDISPIDYYSKYEIQCENAEANYTKALAELNRKLNRQEFMSHKGKITQPIVVLITDDEKSFANCSEQKEVLNNNGWFITSNRLVYFVKGEKKLSAVTSDVLQFVSGSEGLLFSESDLQEIIWSLRPRTIGEKNHRIKELQHDIGTDFVESDFEEWSDDFGGFGDGDFS